MARRRCWRTWRGAPDASHSPRPIWSTNGLVIAQVANILMYLGERHGVAPSIIADRLWLNELQLTIADMVRGGA